MIHLKKQEDANRMIDEIKRLGGSIKDEINRDTYRMNLLNLLANIGDLDGAIKIINMLKDKEDREIQFASLIETLSYQNDFLKAMELLKKISNEWRRARVIETIIHYIMENQTTEKGK